MDDLAQERFCAAEVAAHPQDQPRRIRWARALGKLGRHGEALDVLAEALRLWPMAVELLVEEAIQLTAAGRLDAAEAALGTVAGLRPDHQRLATLRAEIAGARGDHETAARLLGEDSAAAPDQAARRIRFARALARLGRHAQAVEVLSDGLARAPQTPELLIERSVQRRALGLFAAAQDDILALAALKADHPRLPTLRAELAEATGDHVAAERLHAAEAAAHPADSARQIRWARALAQLGRRPQAVDVLSGALERDPQSVPLALEKARQLLAAMRLREAGPAIAAFAALRPNDARIPALQIELAEALGDLETVERLHAAECRKLPLDASRRIRWVRCLARLGRHDEAERILLEGLAGSPRSADLLVEHVSLLRSAGRYRLATQALATLAETMPDERRLPQLRVELAEAIGDFATALKVQQETVEARPRDTGWRMRWVRGLARQHRHEEALAALEAGLALEPASIDLRVAQVTQLGAAGLFAEAATALEELARLSSDAPRLGRLRAELAEGMGDVEEALRLFRADVAAHPEDAGRRMRLVRTLRSSGRFEEVRIVLATSPTRTLVERQAEVECLIESGRWEMAAECLNSWQDKTGSAGRFAALKLRMTLAMMRFDHASAIGYAREVLAFAPGDARAAAALARSTAAMFEADSAWEALLQVPARSPSGGSERRGGGRLRHLVGQIVNDLRVKRDETAALARAAREGDEALVAEAAAQLRDDPGSFGAALGLLMAFARQGRLVRELPGGGLPTTIPRILHQFWDAETPLPDVAALMEHSRRLNADLDYRRWHEASARAFLTALPDPAPLQAYRAARHVAMRADIFRLALLNEQGGVYLDADDYCAGPLAGLVPEGAGFVGHQEEIGSVGNNFLAVRPGHPLIRTALREACAAVIAGASETIWLVTGPGLISRVVACAAAHQPGIALPAGVHVLEAGVFRRVVHTARQIAYKTGKRHWSRAG